MASTVWGLRLRGENLYLGSKGVPLDAYLDGLKRVVFAEDKADIARVGRGDLVVGLGGVAGRSLTSILRLSDKLGRIGAAGLLFHERGLKDPLPKLPHGDGAFPVLAVPAQMDWPAALQPLLKIDASLRSRSGNPERQRRGLVQKIIERGGKVKIAPDLAIEVGLDLLEPFRAVVVSPLAPPTAEILRKLEELVAADLMEHDPLGTVVVRGNDVFAVESASEIVLDRDRLASSLLFRSRSFLALGDLMVGTGRRLAGPEGIFRSVREARWAATVGHQLFGPNRVVDFEELGIYSWLEPIDFENDHAAVAQVQRIIEHDQQHGTRLLETLQTFLDARRFKEAADRLFVHRNTLRYRLDSIRKLTGLDVQDAEARLVLEMQLRLAKVRGLMAEGEKVDA